MKPLISILIPVYNRELLVREAIESALRQSYNNFEVIAVDNYSTDATYEVLKEYKSNNKFQCFQNKFNLGATKNWLECFRRSSGEYIKLLFSDDWLEPNAIELMVNTFIQNTDIGFCYSAVNYHCRDIEGFPSHQIANSLQFNMKLSSQKYLDGFFYKSISVPNSPCQALFRRNDFSRWLTASDHNRMGFLFGKYGMGNDVLLYLRACGEYKYVYHIAEPLVNYRIHKESITVADFSGLGSKGILSAAAYFISESKISEDLIKGYKAILFIDYMRMNLKRIILPWNIPKIISEFRKMFPDDLAADTYISLQKDVLKYLIKVVVDVVIVFFKKIGFKRISKHKAL